MRFKLNKKGKKGFTAIEVVLFLVLSMATLIAITGTITRNVHQQRYNGTLNDFAEFLRGVYSDVQNVQNIRYDVAGVNSYCSIASMWNGNNLVVNNQATESSYQNYPGRSDCVLYGKVITFGENDEKDIYVYDLVGTVYNSGDYYTVNNYTGQTIVKNSFASTIESLSAIKADVATVKGSGTSCKLTYAGEYKKYIPQWEGWAEDKDGNIKKGTIVIARSPLHGTIETYYADTVVNIQEIIDDMSSTSTTCASPNPTKFAPLAKQFIQKQIINNEFKQGNYYLCINSSDKYTERRRVIQIQNNGNNASAVEILPLDFSYIDEYGQKIESETACPKI